MGTTTGPGRRSDPGAAAGRGCPRQGCGDAYRLDGRAAGSAGGSGVRLLDDVNLQLDEAAFAVVLGPSESGKTTLLNLIGALDAPTASTIRLAGRDQTTASRPERTLIRRHTVSFIFQGFNFPSVLPPAARQ